jgi:class 3 adenylate cyclase
LDNRAVAEGAVTLLLTDVEGSTRLWRQDPEAMRSTIAWHDEVVSGCVGEHGGKVLTSHGEGDSVFAVFGQTRDAVAAACCIQRAMHAYRGRPRLSVRIALHSGPAYEEDDYRGSTANKCARIRTYARGGDILLSESATMSVGTDLPEGASLEDCGAWPLRDFGDERIFRLLYGVGDPFVPSITGPDHVSLETLVRCLEDLDDQCQTVRRDLYELQRRDAFVKLRDLLGEGRLGGPTRVRITAMLQGVEEVSGNVRRLESVLAEAKARRRSIKLPKWLLPHPVDQLRDLLLGQSVKVPARDVLQPRRLSPFQLVLATARAIEAADLVVQVVEDVWDRFEPRVVDAERRIQAVRSRARALGEQAVVEEAEKIAATLRSLHERVESDPLAISDDLDHDVGPALDRLDSRLSEIERERASITEDLGRAWALLADIGHFSDQGRAALAGSIREVRDPEGLLEPLDASCLDHLQGWLRQLEERSPAAVRSCTREGLDAWLERGHAALEAAKRVHDANRAPQEELRALEGLLHAEAERERRVVGGRGRRLHELRQELSRLLAVPADLRRAREVLGTYERLLEELLRGDDPNPGAGP